MHNPQFISSYDMAAMYVVAGRRYHVRHGCHLLNTRSDDGYVFEGVVPLIGTVRCEDYDHVREFPSQEVVDLFPGFIGARFNAQYQVEYDGCWMRPRAVWGGDTLLMPGFVERQELDLARWTARHEAASRAAGREVAL